MKTYGYSVWINKRGKVEKVAIDNIGARDEKESAYFEPRVNPSAIMDDCLVYTLPCREPNDSYNIMLAIDHANELRKKVLKCGRWSQTEYLRCYFNFWK